LDKSGSSNDKNRVRGVGDWCVISVDGIILRAKLVHKSRGKYAIIDDAKEGKYIDLIVDASDIIQVEK